jgi:hypothetical protein
MISDKLSLEPDAQRIGTKIMDGDQALTRVL